jgi:ACS family allantoate permease-like MFS transporter
MLAIAAILACFCLALLSAIMLRFYIVRENKKQDRMHGAIDTSEAIVDGMRTDIHDKKDRENTDFRYVL